MGSANPSSSDMGTPEVPGSEVPGCWSRKSRATAGLGCVGFLSFRVPAVCTCVHMCVGVSVHACTERRDTEPATMYRLFSRSCCPHLQHGLLHLFKKNQTQWWAEPERTVAVGQGRETPSPPCLAHPEVLHGMPWCPVSPSYQSSPNGGLRATPSEKEKSGQQSWRG